MQRINTGRLRVVIGFLERVGLERVLELEERDPQYLAVGRVSQTHGVGGASVLAALNALVSYRLAMRGEEWWACWSRLVSGRRCSPCSIGCLCSVEKSFLEECRGSIVQREAKIRRVLRVCSGARSLLGDLCRRPLRVFESGGWLVEGLARVLRAKSTSKTIVFAAKMAYYAARQEWGRRPAPWDVEVPVDVRVACFLYSTGVVEASGYRDLVRAPRTAQEAVRTIAEETGIPPLNLDTVFWLSGWMPRDLDLAEAEERLSELLGIRAEGVFVKSCRG